MGNAFSCISSNLEDTRESNSNRPSWKKLFRRDSHTRIRAEANIQLRQRRERRFDQKLELEDIEDYSYYCSGPKEFVPLPKRVTNDPKEYSSNTHSPRSYSTDTDGEAVELDQPHQEDAENQQNEVRDDQRSTKTPDFIGCGDNYTKDESDRNVDTQVEEWEPLDRVQLHEHYEWDGDEWSPCVPLSETTAGVDDGDDDESKRKEMHQAIANVLELVLEKVEATYSLKEVKDGNNDDHEDRVSSMSPPKIEGYVYFGPGILKATTFGGISTETRRVTWASDVKPPAADGPELDPVTIAFAQERSRLFLTRTAEQRQRQRTARLAKQWYTDYFSKYHRPEAPRSRLPILVASWQPESGKIVEQYETPNRRPVHVTRGCRIPVLVNHTSVKKEKKTFRPHETTMRQTDGRLVWPQRLEDIYSASARAYYLEQFQKTELCKQRLRKMRSGERAWSLGLTPFQRWAAMNANTAVTHSVSVSHGSSKHRSHTARARISTWRRTGPSNC